MTSKHLIGLYSPSMRSGKSTVAHMLQAHIFGKRMGFAEPFYDFVVSVAAPFIGSEAEAKAWLRDERKDTAAIPGLSDCAIGGVTLRWMLQSIGTQWGRELINPHIWTMLAEKRALEALKSYSVIFDDMRFPNEFNLIKSHGGICIKIVRPGEARGNTGTGEGLLDGYEFDHTINNSGTLEELRRSVRALGTQLQRPRAQAWAS